MQSPTTVCRRLIGLHLSDLDQDHDEHAGVEQQDEDNKCHHCHVEEDVALYPAAGGKITSGGQVISSGIYGVGDS